MVNLWNTVKENMRDIMDTFKESNTQKVEILEDEKRHDVKKKKQKAKNDGEKIS